jgi:hypothetical protein
MPLTCDGALMKLQAPAAAQPNRCLCLLLAGAPPPTEKQVSAAARQLLRTLVMEHQTIEEWDSAPGAHG